MVYISETDFLEEKKSAKSFGDFSHQPKHTQLFCVIIGDLYSKLMPV